MNSQHCNFLLSHKDWSIKEFSFKTETSYLFIFLHG